MLIVFLFGDEFHSSAVVTSLPTSVVILITSFILYIFILIVKNSKRFYRDSLHSIVVLCSSAEFCEGFGFVKRQRQN